MTYGKITWAVQQKDICPLFEPVQFNNDDVIAQKTEFSTESATTYIANGHKLYTPSFISTKLMQSGMSPSNAVDAANALANPVNGLVDPTELLAEPADIFSIANLVGSGIMGFVDYRIYVIAERLREGGVDHGRDTSWEKLDNLDPNGNPNLRTTVAVLERLQADEEAQVPEVQMAGLNFYNPAFQTAFEAFRSILTTATTYDDLQNRVLPALSHLEQLADTVTSMSGKYEGRWGGASGHVKTILSRTRDMIETTLWAKRNLRLVIGDEGTIVNILRNTILTVPLGDDLVDMSDYSKFIRILTTPKARPTASYLFTAKGTFRLSEEDQEAMRETERIVASARAEVRATIPHKVAAAAIVGALLAGGAVWWYFSKHDD